MSYEEAVVLSDVLWRYERDGAQERLSFEDKAEQRVARDLIVSSSRPSTRWFDKDGHADVVAHRRWKVRSLQRKVGGAQQAFLALREWPSLRARPTRSATTGRSTVSQLECGEIDCAGLSTIKAYVKALSAILPKVVADLGDRKRILG
jgi:hypothetical protein